MREGLLKRLEGKSFPPELLAELRELLPEPVPHLDTILSRLALVRTFTPKLYDEAVTGLPEPVPTVERFVKSADVQPLIGYEERWSVGESTREDRLDQWASSPVERAEWVERFAKRLDPRDPVEVLDRLQLQFLGDQNTARLALRRAFADATAANDIPRCAALVQCLSSVWKFADTESIALLDELKAASQSRNLFLTEFDQTRKYFSRPLDDELMRFARAGDDRWIFHVWATGGMGKTTMLRRLISHEWVVGPDRLPCAWLDLDYLDVATILQQPALLGLAMAAQWNEQLTQPVFGAFLTTSFKPLSALLFRTRGDGSAVGLPNETMDQQSRAQYRAGLSNPMRCGMLAGAVPPRTPQERDRLLSQTTALLSYWNEKLPDAIATMSDGRPILLFLDTVEDASVHFAGQLLNLLQLLRTLRQQAQARAKALGRPPVNLRLVLSGRNHLGEGDHVPQFRTDFGGECLEQPLEGLKDPEARAFCLGELTRERREKTPDTLLTAMVEKSEGIPFNLSLFAEWANEDEALDETTVRQSEAVSSVMLIERIIKRISNQPLRWIIRYGVVPRNLTLEFLRDVMRQPLVDALSGQARASGADTPDSRLEQDVWHPETDFAFDADSLWNEHVLRYASERNWIRPGDQANQVVFRSDILQPMRRLLKKQVVFARLHERARDWFAESAAGDDRFVAATIEHLYHRVQLRAVPGRAADDLLPPLREFLDSRPLAAAQLRRAVCEELRKADFDQLTSDEQAYVEYRLAEAIAAQNDYSFRTPEAVRRVLQALELWGEAPEGLAPPRPASLMPVFAQLWGSATRGTSVSTLLGAMKDLPPDDQLRLALLITELAPQGSPLAADVLRGAVATAQSMPHPTVPLGVLAERLARNVRWTSPDESIQAFTLAAESYDSRDEAIKRSEMLRQASATELELGRLTRAEAALNPPGTAVRRTPAVSLQLARIELSKGNPGNALNELERTSASRQAEQIEILLLKAEALSQRMLLNEALAAWEEASRTASDQGNTRALSRVAVGQAKLYRWWLRATDAATPGTVQSMLQLARSRRSEAAQRTADAPVGDLDIWQMIFDRDASDRWRRLALGELAGASPIARMRLTLTLSQIVPPIPPRRWQELVEDAERLPRSARFTALAEPVLLGPPVDIEPSMRQSMADAFAYTPEGPIEAAWYAVRYGELLGWLGFYERAVEVLERGVPPFDPSDETQPWRAAVYRERRRIERRIRQWLTAAGRAPFPAPVPDPLFFWWRFWGHTLFRAAAATLENAQTAAEAHQFALVRKCLDLAAPELERVRLDTEFHRIARELQGVGLDGAPEGHPAMPPSLATPESGVGGRLGGAPFTVFELRQQSGHLAVQVEGVPQAFLISADSDTLEILLRAPAIPRRLVGRSLDEIAADLGDALQQSGLDKHGPRVYLQIPLSGLCSAPWELAFPPAPLPVRLPSGWREESIAYESRADRLAVDAEAAASLPVLMQPMSPQDRESPAAQAYVQLGSRFTRRLDDAQAGAPARAVYVASSFIELPDVNEPALAGVSRTASTLSFTIENATFGVRPAVILDVPRPATASDLMHQLFMRNFFAQLLVDSGGVSCVLATGLHPEAATRELHERVMRTLADPKACQIDLWNAVCAFGREAALPAHDAFFTANPYRPFAVERFGYL